MLARVLKYLAIAIPIHGCTLSIWAYCIAPYVADAMPDALLVVGFWVFAAPALLLAYPFSSALWSLGLMTAPGWFAWPSPGGFLLVYSIWTVAFAGLAAVAKRRGFRRGVSQG